METKRKKSQTKYILIGATIGTLGLIGFGYWYFKGRKGVDVKDKDNDLFHKLSKAVEVPSPQPNNIPAPVTSPPKAAISRFPLKKGSRGDLVTQLQEGLIAKFGSSILPTYGADGDFGTETINALKSKGFPVVINKTTFDKIVSDGANTNPSLPASAEQPVDIAKNIWKNANEKNLEGMLSELHRINDVKDYVIINSLFKTIYLRGVRQTIVNAALSSFQDDSSKEQIRQEFLRIGLKNNGNKWTLAGISTKQIITNRATTISDLKGLELEVPAQTLLGELFSEHKGRTGFHTIDNQLLFVPTKHISYL